MDVILRKEERPVWRIALSEILTIFKRDGYGVKFTHQQLKNWMGLREPKKISEVDACKLEYLSGMEKLKKELLETNSLCLFPISGFGYELLHPSDQIRKGAERYIKKSQKNLHRSAQILANADVDQLDSADQELRFSKINRAAFLQQAFRKRKVLPANRIKQIG